MTAEHIAILEDPLQTPGWTWSSKDSSTESKAQTTRKRQPLKPKQDPQDNQESTNPQQRNRSDLEKLHQRYKTMNADTYAATVTAEEFAEYHNVADNYDARDPPERQPLNKIAALLTKFNRPSYTAIDLGCGRNHLRSHAAVAKMTWTSVDVHAFDETVMKADMGALPFEDESFDFAVLSRSLWARNHRDVLQEVMRILKSGGKAVICESFRRWIVGTGAGDTNTNQLTSALMETGFELVFEEGTADKDVTAHVFQYIIARKP